MAAARGGHPPRAGGRRGQRRLRLPPCAGAGGDLRRPAAGPAWPAACRLRPRPGAPYRAARRRRRAPPAPPPSSGASSPTTGTPPTTWARRCWPACRPGRPRRRPRRWPRPSGTTSGRWSCGTRCPRRPPAARWTGARCCTAPPRRPTWPATTTARSPWRRLALDRVDPAAEPLRAGALLERLARYHWTAGDTPQAMAAVERAVATIPAEPPSPELARALAAHGQLLMLLAHQAEARARCEEAVAVARQVGARAVEGHALTTLGTSLGILGQLEAGIADLEQGRRHRQGARQRRRPGPGARQPRHRPGHGRPFRRRRRGLPGRRRRGPPVRRAGTLWSQPAARRRQRAAEPRAPGGGRAAAGRGVRPGPPVARALGPPADRPGNAAAAARATSAARKPTSSASSRSPRRRWTRRTPRRCSRAWPRPPSGTAAWPTRGPPWPTGWRSWPPPRSPTGSPSCAAPGWPSRPRRPSRPAPAMPSAEEQAARELAAGLIDRARAATTAPNVVPTPVVEANLLSAEAEWSRVTGPSDPERWANSAQAWEALGYPWPAGYARWRQAEALLAQGAPRASRRRGPGQGADAGQRARRAAAGRRDRLAGPPGADRAGAPGGRRSAGRARRRSRRRRPTSSA